jgi:hypothetical protein
MPILVRHISFFKSLVEAPEVRSANAFRTFYLSVFSKDSPIKFHFVYEDLLQQFKLEKYIDLKL